MHQLPDGLFSSKRKINSNRSEPNPQNEKAIYVHGLCSLVAPLQRHINYQRNIRIGCDIATYGEKKPISNFIIVYRFYNCILYVTDCREYHFIVPISICTLSKKLVTLSKRSFSKLAIAALFYIDLLIY